MLPPPYHQNVCSSTVENEQKIWKVSAEKSLPNHENEIFFANSFFITVVNTSSPSPPNLAAIRSREVGLPEKTTVNVFVDTHGMFLVGKWQGVVLP